MEDSRVVTAGQRGVHHSSTLQVPRKWGNIAMNLGTSTHIYGYLEGMVFITQQYQQFASRL